MSEAASGPACCPLALVLDYESVLSGQLIGFDGSESNEDGAPPESDGRRHRCALLPLQRCCFCARGSGSGSRISAASRPAPARALTVGFTLTEEKRPR